MPAMWGKNTLAKPGSCSDILLDSSLPRMFAHCQREISEKGLKTDQLTTVSMCMFWDYATWREVCSITWCFSSWNLYWFKQGGDGLSKNNTTKHSFSKYRCFSSYVEISLKTIFIKVINTERFLRQKKQKVCVTLLQEVLHSLWCPSTALIFTVMLQW